MSSRAAARGLRLLQQRGFLTPSRQAPAPTRVRVFWVGGPGVGTGKEYAGGLMGLSGNGGGMPARSGARFMSSGDPAAGAGEYPGVLMQLSGGGAGYGNGGLGAGVGGACSGCSREIAQLRAEITQLRAEMFQQNQSVWGLWAFCSNLLDQNGKLINDMAALRIDTATEMAQIGTSVARLSYGIAVSGVSLAFAVISFMMPYVEKNWQAATVEVVMAEIKKQEEERKARDAADSAKKTSPSDRSTQEEEVGSLRLLRAGEVPGRFSLSTYFSVGFFMISRGC